MRRIIGISVVLALITAFPASTRSPASTRPVTSVRCERLVFVASRPGRVFAVMTSRPDGSKRARLTSWRENPFGEVQWSPDGRRIAYRRYVDGSSAIFVMRRDGSGKRRLTSDKWSDWNLSWAPDGQSIIYQRSASNDRYTIRRVTLRGRVEVIGRGSYPGLSPDGTTIAFVKRASTNTNPLAWPYSLWTMPFDGGPATELSATVGDHYWAPAWSPDGTRIAYQKLPDYGGENPYFDAPSDIYVINADGTDEMRLTEHEGSNKAAWGPAWSPAGTALAFETRRFVTYDDWRESAHTVELGGTVQRVAKELSGTPAWSPDGTRLVFSARRAGRWDLFTATPDGSEPLQVASTKADEYGPSWGGCPS